MKETFEGYYFKVADNDKAVAVIVEENTGTQIITDRDSFQGDDVKLTYDIELGPLSPIKYDAMGPFKFFPFMECRHSVQSMDHNATGCITIKPKNKPAQVFDFQDARGYIEGDRGHSFPTKYFWSQCNVWQEQCFRSHFASEVASHTSYAKPSRHWLSVMVSCAVIPYLGLKFLGTICIVHFNGREIRLATYLGARVKQFTYDKLVITQGWGKRRKILTVTVLEPEKNVHGLRAPVRGQFSRTIYESVCTPVQYKLTMGKAILFDVTGKAAAYEYSEIKNSQDKIVL